MRETLNYLFEEKKQEDGNIGVIHVYRKNDNAWVGFIRYIKKTPDNKTFVKFHASDLGQSLDEDFKQELSEFSKQLSKDWQKKGGAGFAVNSSLDIKMKMIIDKGDGTPPKHITV
jgi:hypothetical protein